MRYHQSKKSPKGGKLCTIENLPREREKGDGKILNNNEISNVCGECEQKHIIFTANRRVHATLKTHHTHTNTISLREHTHTDPMCYGAISKQIIMAL